MTAIVRKTSSETARVLWKQGEQDRVVSPAEYEALRADLRAILSQESA